MSVIVTVSNEPINFAPVSEGEEVVQNVRTILSTFRWTVPLDRSFGVDTSIVDEPIHIARARLSSEILEAITNYEPRANVEAIDFKEELSAGRLVPIVRLGEAGE